MTEKTNRLVTLFGGGGFLGRYVVQALLREGARVRIAGRRPERAYFLRPLGALGQVQFVRADVTDAGSVASAVAGADALVNLVGILKGNFHAIHVEGARHVAEAAAAAGAGALVQVSAIGADPKSESAYGRSKGEGEAAVRAAEPLDSRHIPLLIKLLARQMTAQDRAASGRTCELLASFTSDSQERCERHAEAAQHFIAAEMPEEARQAAARAVNASPYDFMACDMASELAMQAKEPHSPDWAPAAHADTPAK